MAGSLPHRTRALAATIGLALLASVIAGCHSGKASTIHASMTVSTKAELLDLPVSVTVSGLPAGADTTITATAKAKDGKVWTSAAQFTATPAGTLSLAQASHGGSYTGAQAMGLFVYMKPPAGDTADGYFTSPATGFDVTLRASVAGKAVASAVTHRQYPAELGVRTTDLRLAHAGIYGELYQPAKTPTKHAAILLFGGSEGGLSGTLEAKLLAAHGYPTLALAYFKEPGLPQTLAGVPLEYFAKALSLLRVQPGVDPAHVIVHGGSRGGEAALILGSVYPKLVNAVIAEVPNSVVVGSYPPSAKPAWTLHGKELPFSLIPVQQIQGPIFLTCGGDDLVWASCLYTGEITQELSSNHFRYPVTSLNYTDAGHFGAEPEVYDSETAASLDRYGGDQVGNQQAMADAYPKLLAFLAKQ
jgi:dienelactone hydrolase